jgi:hypothetical protein
VVALIWRTIHHRAQNTRERQPGFTASLFLDRRWFIGLDRIKANRSRWIVGRVAIRTSRKAASET